MCFSYFYRLDGFYCISPQRIGQLQSLAKQTSHEKQCNNLIAVKKGNPTCNAVIQINSKFSGHIQDRAAGPIVITTPREPFASSTPNQAPIHQRLSKIGLITTKQWST
jgi:hypothetical protein